MQLQHEIPSALVTGAVEQILPLHVSCHDHPSKSLTQQSVESPGLLLILTLSLVDFRWLQPAHVQHFMAFCLLKTFQNVDHLERIPNLLWSVGTRILIGLHSSDHPQSILNHSNILRGRTSKFELKRDVNSLICCLGHFGWKVTQYTSSVNGVSLSND